MEMLDTKQAAVMIGVAPQTLALWRCRGKGPVFRKLSYRVVRYAVDDLRQWSNERRRASTTATAPPSLAA